MGCLGNSKTAEDQGVDEKERREANKKIEKQLQKERLAYKATHRLLLLGKGGGRLAAPARAERTAQSAASQRGGRAGRAGRGPRAPPATGDPLLQPGAGACWKIPTLGRVIAVWVVGSDGNGVGLQITAIFLFVCRRW